MSYQRWTSGDAYVIATGGGDGQRHQFQCVACSEVICPACQRPIGSLFFDTYRDIIEHLETAHNNSAMALTRLREEAAIVGLDSSWTDEVI